MLRDRVYDLHACGVFGVSRRGTLVRAVGFGGLWFLCFQGGSLDRRSSRRDRKLYISRENYGGGVNGGQLGDGQSRCMSIIIRAVVDGERVALYGQG